MENTYLPLIFSNRLKKLLMSMNDEISNHLFMLEDNSDYNFPFSFIDISDDENSLTFLPANKYNDVPKAKGLGDLIWTIKYRNSIKNGRFINKIAPFYSQQSIEKWVNLFKSEYKNTLRGIKIEVVDGDDIIKYYSGRYYSSGNGPLNKSCMRHDSCSNFMKIYSSNSKKIKMVILRDNEGLISGRALLWKLDEPDGRYLMDRIYVKEDSDAIIFIKYAESNGWLYKTNQSFDCVDVMNGNKSEYIKMKVYLNSKPYSPYPYIDTLQYYNFKENYLTNDNDEYNNVPEIIKLRDIKGKDYGNENFIYDVYNKIYLKADKATYCYYGDGYINSDEAIFLEEYDEYALPDQVVFSKHYDKFILKKYSVFSKKLDDNLLKSDCNVVYFDVNKKEKDYLLKSGINSDHFQCGEDFYYVDLIKKNKLTDKYELNDKKLKLFRKKN